MTALSIDSQHLTGRFPDTSGDEGRYQTLVQQLPDALYVLQNEKLVFINAAGARLLKAKQPSELVGLPLSALIHPDFVEHSYQRVALMLHTGRAAPPMEQRYLCRDGSVIDVEVCSVPFSYESRPAIQVLARDITARKLTERELRRSEERAHALVDDLTRSRALLEHENRILEMMALDCNYSAILDEVCRTIERVLPGSARAAILLLDGGDRLRVGAAPSMPDAFARSIDGMQADRVGSYALTVRADRRIIVDDIDCDPSWEDYRTLAKSHGIQACCTTPIRDGSGGGSGRGVLCLYYAQVHRPGPEDIAFIDIISNLVSNVVGKHEVEQHLQESEDRYRSVVTSLNEGILVKSRDGVILTCNPSAERILQKAPGTLNGTMLRTWIRRIVTEAGTELLTKDWPCRQVFKRNEPQLDVVAGLDLGGDTLVWISMNMMPIRRTAAGPIESVLISFTDISMVKDAQQRLQFMATHDALTGLHNRAFLTDCVAHAITLASRMRHQVGVLFLDLDRFKNVNDTIGHEAGDTLLRTVADRLGGCIRSTDTLARLGGDEFVVMAEGFDDPSYLITLCERILEAVSEPFRLSGHEYYLGVSIGIAVYPQDGGDWPTLLRCADSAMYYAKECGRNNYKFFTSQLNARTQRRYLLERNLRHALAKDEFLVYYQPKIDLQTGAIVGAEALIRWDSLQVGMVQPNDFISIAEETGMIVPIGMWVLENACRQTMIWRMGPAPHLRIAVNLSPRQFQDEKLVESVKDILARTGLPPSALEFEITESLLMSEMDKLAPVFDALTATGISFSLDDFGTGYSSLAYLQRFPIANIKIDRSFISGIPANRDSVALTQAIVAMAQSLDMKVTAEGVEDISQMEFLKHADCQEMQGFLFSKPLCVADFDLLLH